MVEYKLTKDRSKIIKLSKGGEEYDENDDGTGSDECKPTKWKKTPLPKKFNWADLGKVTRVYQQKSCGSW